MAEGFAPWCCPLCGAPLAGENALKCPSGHSFDRAKEGYWHLLPVQNTRTKAPGDSKEMVAARRAFLSAGYYGIFGQALGELCLMYGQPAANGPLRLLDAEGNILCALGELAGCCALLQRELNTWQECNALHAKAGARARELGGSYIYTCTAGLSHISFPLGNREALLGALVVGPFLMEKPDSTLISAFVEGRGLPMSRALELYDELFSLPVIEPARVQALSQLLECLLAPLLPAERALLMQQQEQRF